MTNPNDKIRQQMLQYFFERNINATSEKGKKGSHIKISDVKAELKAKHNLSQTHVTSQLTYLISSGWVDKVMDDRKFTTKSGAQIPKSQEWYVITAAGIDRIEESSSDFMRQNPYSNVNITAVNSAVQLGSGNVVNESFVGLAEDLERFVQAITESDLPEEEKLSAIGDVQTINGQLAKTNPSKEILKMAWSNLQNGNAAKFIQSVSGLSKIGEMVGVL